MNLDRRTAVAALAAAGLLWGTTVPQSKLALEWLAPGWLTVVRFGLAAAALLAADRSRARTAWSPAVLAWGAVGYRGSILVQNAGIARTSVSHGALLVGATPVLVAIVAALRHREIARPVAWLGFAVSLAGVGLVAAGGGGGATLAGDGLVLASLLFSASFTVAQARLLPGRDPVEPLVGAVAGAAAFGDPVGLAQAAGGAAILAGIALSSLPLLASPSRPTKDGIERCSSARSGGRIDSRLHFRGRDLHAAGQRARADRPVRAAHDQRPAGRGDVGQPEHPRRRPAGGDPERPRLRHAHPRAGVRQPARRLAGRGGARPDQRAADPPAHLRAHRCRGHGPHPLHGRHGRLHPGGGAAHDPLHPGRHGQPHPGSPLCHLRQPGAGRQRARRHPGPLRRAAGQPRRGHLRPHHGGGLRPRPLPGVGRRGVAAGACPGARLHAPYPRRRGDGRGPRQDRWRLRHQRPPPDPAGQLAGARAIACSLEFLAGRGVPAMGVDAWSDLYDLIVSRAARLVGARDALLWLTDDEGELVVRRGIGRFSAAVGRRLGEEAVEAGLCVPLAAGGSVVGLLGWPGATRYGWPARPSPSCWVAGASWPRS